MIARPYTPIPGSVAARVIAFLGTFPPGFEATTGSLAASVGFDRKQVTGFLSPALEAGVLGRRKQSPAYRSEWLWKLLRVDGAKAMESAVPRPKVSLARPPEPRAPRPILPVAFASRYDVEALPPIEGSFLDDWNARRGGRG